jgi:hypothetical protein
MKSCDILLWCSLEAGRVDMGRTKKGQMKCDQKSCVDCKQASLCDSKVFCGWLRKFINEPRDDGIEIVVCPRFEMEPLEYRVYRRA